MTFEKIKEIIVENIGCDESEVTMEANLSDDLGMDSLDAVELNMGIEEELGVKIEDEDIAKLATVGDIVKYIEDKLA